MNTLTILLAVSLCLAVVNARHYQQSEFEGQTNDDDSPNLRRGNHGGETRHRRRRWPNYEYNYPQQPFYYPAGDRMDYNRNQDLLPQILRLLDDISISLRRSPPPPPPPPQPIFIPVPYPIPQICSCNGQGSNLVPNITDRINMEDQNQNWGLEVNPINVQDEGDGSRPISFSPIAPLRPISRPAPAVEHGSTQAGEITTDAPKLMAAAQSTPQNRLPGVCSAAVLSCCGYSGNIAQQKNCFTNFGCSTTYAKGNACTRAAITKALESFRLAYSPA